MFHPLTPAINSEESSEKTHREKNLRRKCLALVVAHPSIWLIPGRNHVYTPSRKPRIGLASEQASISGGFLRSISILRSSSEGHDSGEAQV
jgi:hypothetical protein